MGQHLDHQSLSIFNSNYEWNYYGSYLNYKIVYDTFTKIQAEQYDVKCANNEQNWKIYQMRKKYSHLFVNVYQVVITDSQIFCNGNNGGKIYIERIPYRLADLGQLSFNEGLYVLQIALSASEKIYKYFSPILIDENMICFNTKGQCKVWINENLQKNQPNLFYNALTKQEEIIDSLMKTIENRMEYCSKYYAQKNKTKFIHFMDAIEFVNRLRRENDNFKSKIQIPTLQTSNVSKKQQYYQKSSAKNSVHLSSQGHSQSQATATPPNSQIKFKVSCKEYVRIPKLLQKNIKRNKHLLVSPKIDSCNTYQYDNPTQQKLKFSINPIQKRIRSCQKLSKYSRVNSKVSQKLQKKSPNKKSLKKKNIQKKFAKQLLEQFQQQFFHEQEDNKLQGQKICLHRFGNVVTQISQTYRQ